MSEPRKLTTPLTPDVVRSLKRGDAVEVSGLMVTGRDALHKLWTKSWPEYPDLDLRGSVLYHCGPVMRKEKDGSWSVLAAGPTTSIREEPYQADVLDTYKVRGVIGKGGMGKKTSEGLQKTGAVYFHATGGAGSLLAERVKRVADVHMLEEFGSPEAFWVIEAEDFPVVVTMDSHGGSLHEIVLKASQDRAAELAAQ